MSFNDYIFDRDKGICTYCGQPGTIVEHVVPIKFQGPSHSSNLVISCDPCNREKGAGLEFKFLVKGIYRLLSVGEDIGWLDRFFRLPEDEPEDEPEDDRAIELSPEEKTEQEWERKWKIKRREQEWERKWEIKRREEDLMLDASVRSGDLIDELTDRGWNDDWLQEQSLEYLQELLSEKEDEEMMEIMEEDEKEMMEMVEEEEMMEIMEEKEDDS